VSPTDAVVTADMVTPVTDVTVQQQPLIENATLDQDEPDLYMMDHVANLASITRLTAVLGDIIAGDPINTSDFTTVDEDSDAHATDDEDDVLTTPMFHVKRQPKTRDELEMVNSLHSHRELRSKWRYSDDLFGVEKREAEHRSNREELVELLRNLAEANSTALARYVPVASRMRISVCAHGCVFLSLFL
jgi:hypothetical protein